MDWGLNRQLHSLILKYFYFIERVKKIFCKCKNKKCKNVRSAFFVVYIRDEANYILVSAKQSDRRQSNTIT